MDETEWLACQDLDTLIDCVKVSHGAARTKSGRRKLRLFACGCARRVWGLLREEECRLAVEAAERYADGLIGKAELAAATAIAGRKDRKGWSWYVGWLAAQQAITLVVLVPGHARGNLVRSGADNVLEDQHERRAQCDLFRCIFGSPTRLDLPKGYRPPAEVRALAEGVYQERLLPEGALEPQRLGILADALEDLGVASTWIEHLRSPGPHLRGCFVVDLLTGRG